MVQENRSQMKMSVYEREQNRTLSENCEWRRRCYVIWEVVPRCWETGKARQPTVERRTGDIFRRREAEDRSRCVDGISARRVKHDGRYTGLLFGILTSCTKVNMYLTSTYKYCVVCFVFCISNTFALLHNCWRVDAVVVTVNNAVVV